MARTVRFHALGGPEVLRIEDCATPEPGPGEVRIRVKALGLNRAEALMRAGTYIESPPLPSGLGLEAAGIVDRVGAGVADLAPGDAVSVIPPLSMARWPAYGEFAVYPAEMLVRHPASLSWEEAAATWMPYLTAYGALIGFAKLAAGDFVVITAASSSVGIAAIQIANSVGAVPIAITRTDAKRQALLDLGAAHVVISADEDVTARIGAITEGEGARVVFDPVGGPGIAALAEAMAPRGLLIAYGALSPDPSPFPLFAALGKSLTFRGYLVHDVTGDPVRLEAAKAFILDGLAAGTLRPVIDRCFSLDDIVEAHHYLESNAQLGKVVVTV
jgi:NADPH:quinone reductase-like Zn-dependent oxidoreductase